MESMKGGRKGHLAQLQVAVTAAMQQIVADAGGQVAAAKLLGFTQSAVSAVVLGKRLPRVDMLLAMRDALGVASVEEMLRTPAAHAPVAPINVRVELLRKIAEAIDVPPESLFPSDGPDTSARKLADAGRAVVEPRRLGPAARTRKGT